MDRDKMKKIIEEEIKKFEKERVDEGSDFSNFEKKANILKSVSDFAKSVEKFKESMTIEMENSFGSLINSLEELLSDVGKDTDSFLDRNSKGRRSVILKKSDDDVVVAEEKKSRIKFYDSLEEAVKNKTQK